LQICFVERHQWILNITCPLLNQFYALRKHLARSSNHIW
jgi:hypothetical protein